MDCNDGDLQNIFEQLSGSEEHEKKFESKDHDVEEASEDLSQLYYHKISANQLKDYLAKKATCQETTTKVFDYVQKPHKHYYQPGVVAKIDKNTTDHDLCKLLRNDVRTLLVQTAFSSPTELEQIMLKINTAIYNFNMETQYNLPIGLAVEIKGEMLRTGRLRNIKTQEIEIGRLMVLTTNEEYRFVSVKEVIYVYNLWKYMDLLKQGDVILLNNKQIQLRIVKIIGKNITVCIERGEQIESYMDVILPYCLSSNFEPSEDDYEDINFAISNQAHFLIVPHIRSYCWLKLFKKFLNTFSEPLKIAGQIQEDCVTTNSCELIEIIKLLNVIWIPDFFRKKSNPTRFCVTDRNKRITRMGKFCEKPIVVGIPIKTRKDFNKLENHEMLKEIDSILIEKSPIRKAYPIIAKNLQPVPKNYFTNESEPIPRVLHKPNSQLGLLNCLGYTMHNIPCQGIVISSKFNQDMLNYLSSANIYCPIIAVVVDEGTAKDLNLRRNIKSVVHETVPHNNTSQIRYGLSFGKDMKIFWQGDFVLTFFDQIVSGCLATRFNALYIPKEKVIISQRRLE